MLLLGQSLQFEEQKTKDIFLTKPIVTLANKVFLASILSKSFPLTYQPNKYKIGSEKTNLPSSINLKSISSSNDFTNPDIINAAKTIESINKIPITLPESLEKLLISIF